MSSQRSQSGRGRPNKVQKAIEQYELSGLGAELEREWTREDGHRQGLRSLADFVNRELLESAVADAGASLAAEDVDRLYRSLTGDDAEPEEKTEAESRLRARGVDVDRLTDGFVTYQSVRNYLRNVRDASYDPDDDRSAEQELEDVRSLQTRLTDVTSDTIRELDETDEVSAGEISVTSVVRIRCDECGTQYDLADFVERGGCGCKRREPGKRNAEVRTATDD